MIRLVRYRGKFVSGLSAALCSPLFAPRRQGRQLERHRYLALWSREPLLQLPICLRPTALEPLETKLRLGLLGLLFVLHGRDPPRSTPLETCRALTGREVTSPINESP